LSKLAERLVKGAHVFAQGQLTTHEYDRTIKVPAGNGKSIEHTIQQTIVELKANTSGPSIAPPHSEQDEPAMRLSSFRPPGRDGDPRAVQFTLGLTHLPGQPFA
jgi:hypothetical protein